MKKKFEDLFFKREKKILKTLSLSLLFFFGEHLRQCLLALESAVFGLEYFFVSLASSPRLHLCPMFVLGKF